MKQVYWIVNLLFIMCLPLYSQSSVAEMDSAAIADSLSYQVDDVVVTGTRYGKKIIDIPYPVTRVDFREFRYERKAGVSDVLSSVPGLFLQSRYGNHDVRISIRGFGSRSNSGIRGVRILLDGIPESEPDGQTRIEAIDFNSVGRIEIVKGNASSLYTNAPGGVINFINDVDFDRTFLVQFNDFGSYGLRRNGLKYGFKSPAYTWLMTYSYHNSDGYREQSNDWWHIVNTVLETRPSDRTKLQLLGYFVDGQIFLPGSLSKTDFEEDPSQANQRDLDRGTNRYTRKGRLGLRYEVALDKERNNELEITGYGTIKYFERVSSNFRIINRYGLGASGRFINRSVLANRKNEFSMGFDLLNQTGPVEAYVNFGGQKSDILQTLTDETIANVGFYLQNNLNLIDNRLDLLLTGRYDKVIFDVKDQLLGSRGAKRRFEEFTPKAALNYKFTPFIAIYGSVGRSFESPAGNELDNFPTSTQPGILLNPDLKPQETTNLELGIKGNIFRSHAAGFRSMLFEATFFRYIIDNEIVPFEVFSDVFFRNAARTIRNGLEIGGTVDVYRGLQLNVAYTFSDFSYDSYKALSLSVGNNGAITNEESDFSGNIVPSVPRHNLNIALSKSFNLTPDHAFFVKGGMWDVSGLYTDDANSEQSEGYRLFNALIGLDVFKNSPLNLLLSAGVNNITDETYVAFVNINSARQEFYEAGLPRNFFGSIKLGLQF